MSYLDYYYFLQKLMSSIISFVLTVLNFCWTDSFSTITGGMDTIVTLLFYFHPFLPDNFFKQLQFIFSTLIVYLGVKFDLMVNDYLYSNVLCVILHKNKN